MENKDKLPNQPTTEVQAPVSSVVPITDKKRKLVIIVGVIIILLLVAGGSYMLGQRNVLQPSLPQNSIPPTNIPQSSENSVTPTTFSKSPAKSNQIRVFGLVLTYPNQWIPIFAPQSNSKNVIYFAVYAQFGNRLNIIYV